MIGLMFAGQSLAEIDKETCVGAWLFEDISGNKAIDSSGNGNDGDINGGPGLVAGYSGKAMDFDGENDFIIVPDSDSLELEFVTMAAWVKLRSYTEDARIITQEVDGDPYSTYSLTMGGAGWKKLEIRITLDNNRKRLYSNMDIPLDIWVHVAATYDGEKVIFYVNGEFEMESPQSGTLLTTDNPLYIGASQFWDPRFIDGLLDDVLLFNVALTQDQVKELVENGIAGILAVSSQGKLLATWAQIKQDQASSP
jgi:hypothetical protein